MAVGFVNTNVKYDITVLGNEIFMSCGGDFTCGVNVGQIASASAPMTLPLI